MSGPKILVLDIETTPIVSYTWGLWDQNVALNQIKSEWNVLSWAAKWYTDANGNTHGPHKKIMYADQRDARDIRNDKNLLRGIWELVNECDVALTQNGIAFDLKKLNARFVMNGMAPPKSHRNIDTLRIAKKHFAFTSNKLEWMTDKLCRDSKKMKTKKFQGFDLWKECLRGNLEAFKEIEDYNKMDVLSLEELYHTLQPWDNSLDFNTYFDDTNLRCNCGSKTFKKNGFKFTTVGKFQIYQCLSCRAQRTSRINLLSKEKKESLRR